MAIAGSTCSRKERVAELRRDLVFSLSSANLCFLGGWSALVEPSAGYSRHAATPNEYLALMLDVLLLAAAFFFILTLVRRLDRPFAWKAVRAALGLLLLIPLNVLRMQVRNLWMPSLFERFGPSVLRVSLIALGLVLVVILVRRLELFGRVAGFVVLLLSPLVPMLFANAVWLMLHPRPDGGNRHAYALAATDTSRPRVLWLIFDEFDQRLAFGERPASVRLPEMDRIRSQAIYASNAFRPAGWTVLSLPSLINGSVVSDAKPGGPDELMITYAGSGGPVPWSAQPTVFSRVRDAGFNTALVGSYHPYCRVLGSSLTFCSQSFVAASEPGSTLPVLLVDGFRGIVGTFPVAGRLPRFESVCRQGREMYLRVLQDARKVAVDPAFGLAFIHWPVPHSPFIYSRSRNDFALDGSGTYLDNLVLVDLTLGDLRRTMESAGTWENSTVLISSDHGLRGHIEDLLPAWGGRRPMAAHGGTDRRVPFLMKLPHQRQAAAYDAPFNTVVSCDLVLALLRGELSSTANVIQWIDQHRMPGARDRLPSQERATSPNGEDEGVQHDRFQQ